MRGFCREEACSFKHDSEKKGVNSSSKRLNSSFNDDRDAKRRKDSDVEERISRMESFLVTALGANHRPSSPVQSPVWNHQPAWPVAPQPQVWAGVQSQVMQNRNQAQAYPGGLFRR